nr:DNA helicase [Tanacetum cinerariifolium]
MVDLPGKKSTTSTEWFTFNEANEAGRHLSYLEFPLEVLKCKLSTTFFYPTYTVACQALGLLGDDKEWEIAFEEACGSATPEELRFFFPHTPLL